MGTFENFIWKSDGLFQSSDRNATNNETNKIIGGWAG